MRKHTIAKLALLLFAITLISAYAFGLVKKMSIEELTKRANLIVMGTVVSTESQWEYVSGGGQRIFTYVYIDVEKYIKGLGGELIDIKVPGGTVDEITEWVSDTPQFNEGERVIVFLRDEFFQVVGWNQGKFTIKDDKVVSLEVPVSEFITIIQKTDKESLLGLRDVLPTDIKQAEIQLKSEETPDIEEPCREVLDKSVLKPTVIKAEPKKEISDKPVSIERMLIPAPGWITIMTEDFEGVFPSSGWTLYGDPTWDDDDYKPHTGGWSAWCANGGPSGIDPEFNDYPINMNAWMVYGPFDLSDAVDAELLFYYWNISEIYYDWFMWAASLDGSYFYGYRVSGDSGGWKSKNFDLTNVYEIGNLCGDDSVWIAFKFDSDYMINYKGAFVDDIVLQKAPLPTVDNIIAGHGLGGKSWVKLFGVDGNPIRAFKVFGSVNVQGEVHVAGGDVDVDMHDEIAAGQGEGGKSWVKFFEVDGSLISTFKAFGAANTNGEVHVTIGNFDEDTSDKEIAVAQGEGGQSWVKVFKVDGTFIRALKAFGGANAKGEVHLATGDLNKDGFDEIITGTGENSISMVKIFHYWGGLIRNFKAFDSIDNPGGEIRLAVGNFDADSAVEIAAATGYNGGNLVRLFDKDGTSIGEFTAFGFGGNPNGDVQITAADIDNDGVWEIICGHGEGGSSWVKVFKPDGTLIRSFKAFGGVNAQGEVHLTRCKY